MGGAGAGAIVAGHSIILLKSGLEPYSTLLGSRTWHEVQQHIINPMQLMQPSGTKAGFAALDDLQGGWRAWE